MLLLSLSSSPSPSSSHSSMLRLAASLPRATPRTWKTEVVWAKTLRKPLILPTRKLERSGKVAVAERTERREPKPAMVKVLSGCCRGGRCFFFFFGGDDDVREEEEEEEERRRSLWGELLLRSTFLLTRTIELKSGPWSGSSGRRGCDDDDDDLDDDALIRAGRAGAEAASPPRLRRQREEEEEEARELVGRILLERTQK